MSATESGVTGIPVPGIVTGQAERFGPGPEREDELTFERKPMVGWFDPRELLRTAARAGLSSVFGQYADKRELQAALRLPEPHDYTDLDEVWIDFVCDLGDGFDSTYSVAWLLSRLELTVAGAEGPLPRSRILVMGGDQVYPTASREEYNDRMAGPYEAALPCVPPPATAPHLFAIPGNHDWYDGLTSFIRLFCQNRWIGGWQTQQRRSYFALKLPRGWWLWGTDIALESDIDKPQLDFFERVARDDMQPGDRVILCTAEPSWVFTGLKAEDAFDNLEYLEREVIRKHGHTLGLTLTGDMHHYARYARPDGSDQKITAGGGGAYLVSTHHLPDRLALPEKQPRDGTRYKPEVRRVAYERKAAYPDPETSRAMVSGARGFARNNSSFVLQILAPFYALYGALLVFQLYWLLHRPLAEEGLLPAEAAATAARSGGWGTIVDTLLQLVQFATPPLLVGLAIALWLGLTGLAKMTPGLERGRSRLFGLLHALAHLTVLTLAAIAATALALRLGITGGGAVFFAALAILALYALGYLVGGLIVGHYLVLADGRGVNTNESFAAQRIEDYKNFVRLHVDRSGTLTVYPVGIERINRDWRFVASAAPGESFYQPAGDPPPAHLIEAPIIIAGRAAPQLRADQPARGQ